MAAAAKTLFALCALLAGASAVNQCTTETYGYVTAWETPLPPITLDTSSRDWRITIPLQAACANLPGYAVGVMVTVCDPDSPPPPTVQILSLALALVKRNSYLFSPANVYVNVYCKPHRHRGIKDAREVGEVEGVADVAGVVGESRGDLSRLRATVVGVGGRGALTAVPLG